MTIAVAVVGLIGVSVWLAWISAGPAQAAPGEPAAHDGEDIRDVLARRGKIAAIKAMRERTGMGLAEAKEAVEALEGSVREEALLFGAPRDLEADVLALLERGQRIEAIRRIRAGTGWDLKAAAEYLDALERLR